MATRLLSKVRFLALLLPLYGILSAIETGCIGGGEGLGYCGYGYDDYGCNDGYDR
jgi:hypothetical protein